MRRESWIRSLLGPSIDALRRLGARLSPAERRRRKRHAHVGPPGMWEMKRDFQIAFLRKAGLQPGHRLVDIGCGTLRGGLPLIRYLEPGHYVGVEAREEALTEARRELEENGLTDKDATLVHGSDLTQLNLPMQFDYAWAFSVLFHMPDDVLEGCIGFVARHLRPGGVFYANVHVGERKSRKWKQFPVVWRSMDFYRSLAIRHGMSVEDIGSLAEVGHDSGRPSHDEQRMLKFNRPAA